MVEATKEGLIYSTKNSYYQPREDGDYDYYIYEEFNEYSQYTGNLLKSYDSLGNDTSYKYYNVADLIHEVTEPNDSTSIYTYDDYGRVITITKEDRQIYYDYNPNTGLIEVVHLKYKGNINDHIYYNIIYDDYGRMTEVKINNNNALVNYQYDSEISDLLEIESYIDGTSIKYLYDYNNRLIDVLIKHLNTVDYISVYEYEYDSAGRLLSYTENDLEDPTVYSYIYDEYGNVAYVIKNGIKIQENISDSRGNIKERIFNFNDLVSKVSYNYSYAKKRFSSITYNAQINEGQIYKFSKNNSYESDYYGFGRYTGYQVNTINNDQSTGVYSLRYTYKSIYDEVSQNYIDAQYINKEIIRKLSNYSTLFNFSYEYDEMGYICKITNNLDGKYIVYDYDKKGQLSEEKYYDSASIWRSIKYFYDVNGNISSRQYYNSSYNGGNAPANYDNFSYSSNNWKDQITCITIDQNTCSSTYAYDQIGNLEFDYNKGLQYDFNGKQLHSVKNLSNNGNITFAYNGSGIRTGKVLSYFTSNRLSYTDYDLDGNKIMHEFIHNDPLYGSDTHLYYNYDENGKILSVTLRNDIELIFETYFYITNILGDVIGIVDSNGTLIEEYKYDAWGNLLNENEIYSDIGILNPFRYRGYYYDSDLGLYYLNSRYYNPEIGRFISTDNVEYTFFESGNIYALNLYSYCGNNRAPVRRFIYSW